MGPAIAPRAAVLRIPAGCVASAPTSSAPFSFAGPTPEEHPVLRADFSPAHRRHLVSQRM